MIKDRSDLGERCASHVDMESEQAAQWFEPSLHLESLFPGSYFFGATIFVAIHPTVFF
jgi:hypothetical protein